MTEVYALTVYTIAVIAAGRAFREATSSEPGGQAELGGVLRTAAAISFALVSAGFALGWLP